MITIWRFFSALPALFKLFAAIEAHIKEAQADRKVVDDIKTIHGAFIEKDPAKLNALFASE